jgi:hypothetical protein
MTVPRTKPCEHCGTDFRPRRKSSRFCSLACMGEAKRLSAEHRGDTAEKLLCTKCRKIKAVADFYPHAILARGYQYWCKTCMHQKRIERAKIPLDPHTRRRYALWSGYRITPGDYDAMYQQQRGKCAICGIPKEPWEPASVKDRPRFLVVDHDHATGEVRGLLCSDCNHGIGKFKENQENLRAAIAYLQVSPVSGLFLPGRP